jgi:hypothetical protein
MSYRSLRKFKQQQREYECLQNREQDAYFEGEQTPTYEEQEDRASDDYYADLDAAARQYASPIRGVTLMDEMGVGR